ncbi:hypothetical protein H0H87_010187 [Tephrocybe sp. NHM501043]|nr:hypothetical protein H0H87_010187 [Tephrocybe sp. NHM501043]
MFPVPASAAICAFSLETSDGRIVKGVAKDKDIAQQEFEDAQQTGQLAGLVNYGGMDDIFTISIGSVSALAYVEAYVEYVMILANDDNADEIRFQLSSGVGQRYGTPPDELTSALRPTERTRIKITCDIQTSGRLKQVVSPTHPLDISETKYVTSAGRPSRRRTTIKYRSRSFLDRDFVLIISASGLDSPRCFSELQEDSQNRITLALQLVLVPKLCLPPIAAQEYLFVVDRSGSMRGSRIATAKDTLALLLRMLPSVGTIFNIYIFDNNVESFSSHGISYSEKNLKDASDYVDRIEPRGGTEIAKAMNHVLQARNHAIPTAVFVLTDGEVFSGELNDPIEVVRNGVRNASRTAPLRVFTLGISSQVSTAICEGISSAGNGVHMYATEAEDILGKCARLFRAGRTPFVNQVVIDWGLSSEQIGQIGVTFSNQTLSPRTIATLPPPTIQQAPTDVQTLHAGTQLVVFAIVQLKRASVPAKVVVRGVYDNGGEFEIRVPIGGVYLEDANRGLPLIHTLAAWRLIQEHERKRASLPSSIMPASDDEIRRAIIVNLGEKYQLVSQYTSFVAVDYGQGDRRRPRRHPAPRGEPQRQAPDVARPRWGAFGFLQAAVNLFSEFFNGEGQMTHEETETLPGTWPLSPSNSENEVDDDDGSAESDGSADSHETFSTMSSLNSCDCSDDSVPPSPRLISVLSPEEEERRRQRSPRIHSLNLDSRHAPLPRIQPTLPPIGATVVRLIRLQSFDGSYSLEDLRAIPGIEGAVNEVNNWSVDGKVWATALTIAFIQKQMTGQKELATDLLMKALEYLNGLDVDVDELLQTAKDALRDLKVII